MEEDANGETEEGDSVGWLLRRRKKPEEDLKAARRNRTRPGTVYKLYYLSWLDVLFASAEREQRHQEEGPN